MPMTVNVEKRPDSLTIMLFQPTVHQVDPSIDLVNLM